MSKRYLIIILVLVLALFVLSGIGLASDPIYINSADGVFDGALSSLYAIGGEGTALIFGDSAWALTGSGLAMLGRQPDDDIGSSGLEYADGSIAIKSNVVKVGLKYYYSSSRNSSLEKANLENAVGSGYAFGYFDADRIFHELDRTEQTKITMRITSGTSIGIYITGTDSILYEHEDSSIENMLAVMPLSSAGDAVTWFSGYKYYGGFEYVILGGGVNVINVVDLEKYVMGVCASEMNDSWPLEALKAQAVCARTYAQKLIGSSVYLGRCGFDLTNDTYCQAYSGCSNVGLNIQAAVLATANQYITYKGSLIDALYFSSDGGATESNVNVNGNDYHPYLMGKLDPYEAMSNFINPYSSWKTELTPAVLGGKVGLNKIVSVVPTLSATGNVIKLELTDINGNTAVLERDACRTRLGMFSLRYSVSVKENGNFLFTGSGWGHSLGMSQYGAYSMARYYELTYKDILGFYYTGVGLSYGV